MNRFIDSGIFSRKESTTNEKKRDSSVVTDSDDEPTTREATAENSKRNQLKSKEKRTKTSDEKDVAVEIDRPIVPEKVFRLLLLGDAVIYFVFIQILD